MFAFMLVFGLLTWVLYRKARPFYAAHLYVLVIVIAMIVVGLRNARQHPPGAPAPASDHSACCVSDAPAARRATLGSGIHPYAS